MLGLSSAEAAGPAQRPLPIRNRLHWPSSILTTTVTRRVAAGRNASRIAVAASLFRARARPSGLNRSHAMLCSLRQTRARSPLARGGDYFEGPSRLVRSGSQRSCESSRMDAHASRTCRSCTCRSALNDHLHPERELRTHIRTMSDTSRSSSRALLPRLCPHRGVPTSMSTSMHVFVDTALPLRLYSPHEPYSCEHVL